MTAAFFLENRPMAITSKKKRHESFQNLSPYGTTADEYDKPDRIVRVDHNTNKFTVPVHST